MTVYWLYLYVETTWIGERLPPRPPKKGWWLCWLAADVMHNGRFDERRVHLLKIPCFSVSDIDDQYRKVDRQSRIPSCVVTLKKLTPSQYWAARAELGDKCKELNEEFSAPAYLGDCLDRRVKQ